MKKPVFVWRESVYKNDFRCNVCKKKLSNGAEPIGDAILVAKNYPQKDQDTIVCADCKNPVAIMSMIETDLEGGLYGHIGEEWEGGDK